MMEPPPDLSWVKTVGIRDVGKGRHRRKRGDRRYFIGDREVTKRQFDESDEYESTPH